MHQTASEWSLDVPSEATDCQDHFTHGYLSHIQMHFNHYKCSAITIIMMMLMLMMMMMTPGDEDSESSPGCCRIMGEQIKGGKSGAKTGRRETYFAKVC